MGQQDIDQNINPQKKITCVCPECNTIKEISIPIAVIKEEKLSHISIPRFLICEHTFQAFVDPNFKIRGYSRVDFEFTVPQPKDELKSVSNEINFVKFKQSISILSLSTIFYGCFRDRGLVLIIDYYLKELKPDILKFFTYVFKDSFDFDIKIMTLEEYKQNKKNYKNYIILERSKIIRPKNLNLYEVKSERKIVQKFFVHESPEAFLETSRNEIKKIYNFSESIKK